MGIFDREYYLDGLCISNQPIPFKGQYVYQPLIKDIFEIGTDEFFKKNIQPWCSSIDILPNAELFKKSNFNIFDLLLLNERDRQIVIDSLKYYLHLDDNDILFNVNNLAIPYLYIKKNIVNEVGNSAVEENDIWTSKDLLELQKIITFITNYKVMTKKDIKEKDEEEDEYDLDSIADNPELMKRFKHLIDANKLEEHKRQKEESKYFQLFNIFRYVLLAGRFNRNEVLNWNIYCLHDMYRCLEAKTQYMYDQLIFTNAMFDTKGHEFRSLQKRIIK